VKANPIFTGSCCAVVTPFDRSGAPNYKVLGEIIEFLIAEKTDALIACGTTGEASTLNDTEHLQVIEYIINKVDGRIPVVAGTGSNDTIHGINLCKEAQKLGADGLLTVTPYYNKATQNGLIRHYSTIADNVDIPIILYNVPGRTGVNIAPQTLLKLSEHQNIVAIKEASGNMAQVAAMMALCGDKIDFYSGCDEINVPIMSLGGKGAISVLANIAPRKTHDMMQSALDGDYKTAAKLQLEAIDIINALFCEVNPIPVKEAMAMMGFDTGIMRLPLCEMEPANRERLKKAMENYGLI